MKRTIIIDTDNNTVDLLQDGYNIIEKSFYDDDIATTKAIDLLKTIMLSDEFNTDY